MYFLPNLSKRKNSRRLYLTRVEISRASYEPLGDFEAHLKHFKPPQPL